MPDSPSPFQEQNQSQAVTVNLQGSRDPQLEARIFRDLYSAGSQLGRISATLEVVLRALEGNPALQPQEAQDVLAQFKAMQREISEAKRSREPQHFLDQLDALRQENPEAYDAVLARLREWLPNAPAGQA